MSDALNERDAAMAVGEVRNSFQCDIATIQADSADLFSVGINTEMEPLDQQIAARNTAPGGVGKGVGMKQIDTTTGFKIARGAARMRALDTLLEHRFEMQAPSIGMTLPSRAYRHWDIVTNGAQTAFAVVSRDVRDKTPCDLELFLVLPEHRGAGIGRSFLRTLAEVYGPLCGDCYIADQAAFYRKAGCFVNAYHGGTGFRFGLRPLCSNTVAVSA